MIKLAIWKDKKDYIELIPPKEFNFKECMVYIDRSDNECMHKVTDNIIFKAVEIGKKITLLRVSSSLGCIRVDFPCEGTDAETRGLAAEYVWEMFDLSRELSCFYTAVRNDHVLKEITRKYFGLRIISMPDLFEALAWAVIGQQINLTFAYTLKRRFVEAYGEKFLFQDEAYWLFPKPEIISKLRPEDLMKLQFTSKKSEYVIGIAKLLEEGKLRKEELMELDYNETKASLTAIRGVGNWTADYVMMKCLRYNQAFPISDVGLHNALKAILGLKDKPSLKEIEGMASGWSGFEAYAVFYLWRSLYD